MQKKQKKMDIKGKRTFPRAFSDARHVARAALEMGQEALASGARNACGWVGCKAECACLDLVHSVGGGGRWWSGLGHVKDLQHHWHRMPLHFHL